MRPSDLLLRVIAIRLGILVAILYAARMVAPGEGQTPAWPEAAPVALAGASSGCDRVVPATERDREIDARLHDMASHD